MKIAIIGAGPAGLAVAHKLTISNYEVDVFDNQAQVGGFAKSIELWDRKVEIGPHFLNVGIIPEVDRTVSGIVGDNYLTYERKTFIITRGKMFYYPPAITDIFKKMGVNDVCKATGSFLIQHLRKTEIEANAEDFVKQKLGLHLYQYFFESFSRKLWGLNGNQVSDVFAKSLLGFDTGFTPAKIIYTKIKRKFKPEKNPHKYLYFKGGLSTLWNTMKQKIEAAGGNFHLSTPIKALHYTSNDNLSGLILEDGSFKQYDAFVSTIPIQSLIKYLDQSDKEIVSNNKVNFRNDVLVYLKVKSERPISGQCFYCYSEDTQLTRVTNFDEFTPGLKGDFNILLAEFWCGKDDKIWQASNDEILEIVKNELKKNPVFKDVEILDAHVKKIPNAFQVPDLDLLKNREKLLSNIPAFNNLYLTGRTTSINFNYGMENAIHDGLKTASELIAALNAQPQNVPL
ncbi:MAG: FAD-dependent oxidoreductase [Mucilaginibacter sp.]|nr:FAD-dependent oxidoreductase [Mucilaginibacter sp.]